MISPATVSKNYISDQTIIRIINFISNNTAESASVYYKCRK